MASPSLSPLRCLGAFTASPCIFFILCMASPSLSPFRCLGMCTLIASPAGWWEGRDGGVGWTGGPIGSYALYGVTRRNAHSAAHIAPPALDAPPFPAAHHPISPAPSGGMAGGCGRREGRPAQRQTTSLACPALPCPPPPARPHVGRTNPSAPAPDSQQVLHQPPNTPTPPTHAPSPWPDRERADTAVAANRATMQKTANFMVGGLEGSDGGWAGVVGVGVAVSRRLGADPARPALGVGPWGVRAAQPRSANRGRAAARPSLSRHGA